MSALAQMLKWQRVDVSGSDRALNNPENAAIFSALREQGIRLYLQDGSYAEKSSPDVLVYSSAIEDDNPDFTALPQIKKIHRADMLSMAIAAVDQGNTIAVSGSCGKTTVTAWLTEILYLLDQDPVMIGGGLSNRFISKQAAGNFQIGNGGFTVFEADESDKSLLSFNPDFAIILNIGTDHYPREELRELFCNFLKRIRKGVVVSDEVYKFLGEKSFANLKVAIFADETEKKIISQVIARGQNGSDPFDKLRTGKQNPPHPKGVKMEGHTSCVRSFTIASSDKEIKFWSVDKYLSENGISEITLNDKIGLSLPFPGKHSALNAAAILAMCEMLEVDTAAALKHITDFQGVWRRFDYAGQLASGVKVYDDYAHNVEKIISCIKTAKEVAEGRVLAVFQPHGFAPLKFMREPLFEALESTLDADDIFAFLPVYYAGGSASFSPSSEEVFTDYQSRAQKRYLYFNSREEAIKKLQSISSSGDVIIVMGARDNSLSGFAQNFTC